MKTIDVRPAELFTGLAGIRELIDSDMEVDPRIDIVVGVLPEVLKRLYTFWKQAEKLAADTELSECAVCLAKKKAQLLEDWFFLCVRDEFGLGEEQGCPDIAIKKGFKAIRAAIFPSAEEDEGGVTVLRFPTKEEKENCGWAKQAGAECPQKKFVFGAPSRPRSCKSCPYHPLQKALKKMFVSAKENR